MIEVVPVSTDPQFKKFIEFPYTLYRNNRYWVPPLRSEVVKLFDTKYNPFWQHSRRQMFLAYRNRQLAGRVCAIIDDNYLDFWRAKTGYFGFFECDDDEEAARALIGEARKYLGENGMDKFIGPMNPSSNDEMGFLLDGYYMPPMIMMTYNFEYYHKLMAAAGMRKAKDLFAFYLETKACPVDYLERMCSIVRKRVHDLKVRPVRVSDFANEVKKVKEVYNDAWSRNWGFVPMTDAEFAQLARNLKDLVVPELVTIVEINETPAAVAVAVPDYNFVLHKLGGRLGLVGMIKFLHYRKKIREARLMILGIRREYQKLGLEAFLIRETIRGCQQLDYLGGEMSWTLEDNHPINNTITKMGGKLYKKYRMYEGRV